MANLASIILEGINTTPSTDYNDYKFDSNRVVMDSSFPDMAIATLFTNIMETEQSYMVADVVGAATVIYECNNGNEVDPVNVQESIIKDGIAKLQAAFKKFINKIKEYYHKVIAWFKAMTSNAEDFAKNFGDAIKKKANTKSKGFRYTGFKYTLSNGKTYSDRVKKLANDKMSEVLKSFDAVKDLNATELGAYLRNEGLISKDFKVDEKPSASDVIDEELNKSLRVSDISDLKTEITEAYRDGESEPHIIDDFEDNSVSEMVDMLKTSGKFISDLEKEVRNYEKPVNAIIKKLDGFKAEKDEEGATNLVSNASYLSSLMTAWLNIYKVPCECTISIYKGATSEYLGILKKFYRYKGVKESSEIFEPEMYALLEADTEDDEDGEPKDAATESVITGILEQAARYTF